MTSGSRRHWIVRALQGPDASFHKQLRQHEAPLSRRENGCFSKGIRRASNSKCQRIAAKKFDELYALSWVLGVSSFRVCSMCPPAQLSNQKGSLIRCGTGMHGVVACIRVVVRLVPGPVIGALARMIIFLVR